MVVSQVFLKHSTLGHYPNRELKRVDGFPENSKVSFYFQEHQSVVEGGWPGRDPGVRVSSACDLRQGLDFWFW